MKDFLRWCKRYISGFTVLVAVGVTYMLLIQDNSMFRYNDYQRTIDSLTIEIRKANDTIALYQRLNSQLNIDPELMEKVVREQYNMMREGEDVYVFK